MGEYTKIINGIPIKFPYENPYIQIKYMEKVIESLEHKKHALLESPTGTGKTLSLLCATLGWVSKQRDIRNKWRSRLLGNSNNNDDDEMEEGEGEDAEADEENKNDVSSDEIIPMENIPKVIYASRTHSQISQAMKELKNSPYKDFHAAVFASRTQLCINPHVKNTSNVLYKCRTLRRNNGCEYKNNVISSLKEPDFKAPILDIEDLCRTGEKFNCCPYYASMMLRYDAEIIFLPYNYLLDPKIRDFSSIDFKNAIVILDEAHNVENVCEQSACTSITTTDFDEASSDLEFILEILGEAESNEEANQGQMFKREDVKKLQLTLQTLQNSIICIPTVDQPGKFIFELFRRVEITNGNYKDLTKLLDDLIKFACNESRDAKGLNKISEFLRVAFSSSTQDMENKIDQCCEVHLKNNADFRHSKTLNFRCFSPALGLKHLLDSEIRCLIMTSGTLEPLNELETEMEIPSPIKFINKHIIDPSQVFANIVSYGPDGEVLNSTLRNRDNRNYLKSLGESIVKLCDAIPDGMLIFFASYAIMEKCTDFWGKTGIWLKMLAKRDIYRETQKMSSNALNEMKKNYYDSIHEKKGAIFMAVLRGKVSEGVDFPDMYGRACVIVGIPLAAYKSKAIESKMAYMNRKQLSNRNSLTGSDWYCLDAIRAVNQAIGRVIRHKYDYGAILLCDNRFNHWDKKRYISTWVKDKLGQNANYFPDNFQTTVRKLKDFFAHCEETLPKPKRQKPSSVFLDLSEDDDDELYRTNVSDMSYAINAENSQDENSDDRDFITDGSIDDQYSNSSNSEGLETIPSVLNKRQRKSPKKRSVNGRTKPYTLRNKKLKKVAESSDAAEAVESSEDINTDDERFIDDGQSTDDEYFISDGPVNDQYSSSSCSENLNIKSNKKRPVTRSKTLKKRQSTRGRSAKSPQPSTKNEKRQRESDNDDSDNDSNSDDSMKHMKRAKNGKKYKRIISISDSDTESDNSNGNSILAYFQQSLAPSRFKQLLQAFNEYNSGNGSYESYRDTLFEIFNGADDDANLIGMMWFLKPKHQSKFSSDIQKKLTDSNT